jgi:hypothetical protein
MSPEEEATLVAQLAPWIEARERALLSRLVDDLRDEGPRHSAAAVSEWARVQGYFPA